MVQSKAEVDVSAANAEDFFKYKMGALLRWDDDF